MHGIPVDEVHFHELADWDSLLDVVAAGCIAAQLDGARWTASALPLGGGTVRTAHGLLPVPAPATSLLLTGYPWHDDGIAGERVTPTGAAILRHLVPAAQCGTRRDAGRLLSVGSGAGTRALPGLPNILRALVLERGAASDADADAVTVLEFDVDDMTGEEIAVAADRLRAEPRRRSTCRSARGTARRGARSRISGCWCNRTRPTRSRRPASPKRRRWDCAGARSAGACCGEPRSRRRSTAPRSSAKIAVRPGGERTAKGRAGRRRLSTRGLGERRRVSATAERRVLKAATRARPADDMNARASRRARCSRGSSRPSTATTGSRSPFPAGSTR